METIDGIIIAVAVGIVAYTLTRLHDWHQKTNAKDKADDWDTEQFWSDYYKRNYD